MKMLYPSMRVLSYLLPQSKNKSVIKQTDCTLKDLLNRNTLETSRFC